VRQVNELASKKRQQAESHKRYNTTQKQLAKIARTLLAPDEIESIKRQVEEKELG
jgi:hypothetical protein